MTHTPTQNKLPRPINLNEVLTTPLPEVDFVLPGLKTASVGALISPGGAGKSYWILQLAVAMTGGARSDLTGLNPKQGKTIILSREDDYIVLAQRIHALKNKLPRDCNLTGFDYVDCVGIDINIMLDVWFNQICEKAKGARLVVMDTISRFHTLDENSSSDMKWLMSRLEQLAQKTGAAVLYLHHTNKISVLSGNSAIAQAARGSSVLIDNARWMASMASMSEQEAKQLGVSMDEREDYVRWSISKQNYGHKHPDIWYQRCEGGVLTPISTPRKDKATSCTNQTKQANDYRDDRTSPQGMVIPVRTGAIPSAKNFNEGAW